MNGDFNLFFLSWVKKVPIYTTYLGFLNKHGGAHKVGMELGSCFIYYVMRNRGNNEVAPSKQLLTDAKSGLIGWATYQKRYLTQISPYTKEFLDAWKHENPAIEWMEKRAGEAEIGNILLVCYEKDATHCHRRLLAEEIVRRFGVEYKGELSENT